MQGTSCLQGILEKGLSWKWLMICRVEECKYVTTFCLDLHQTALWELHYQTYHTANGFLRYPLGDDIALDFVKVFVLELWP